MKTIVHFGAGAIGRSLVGSLFSAAGWRIVFVDVDARIIGALNVRGGYGVKIRDELPPGASEVLEVRNVSGLLSGDMDAVAAAAASADLLGSSVGGNVLPKILPAIAEGLRRRAERGGLPLSMLLCENLHGAGDLVRNELRRLLPADFPLAGRFGAVETSIGKMVPIMPAEVRERDPLEVWGEAYNRIVADRDGVVGPIPEVPGIDWKTPFGAWVERKLYIHNFGHAAAAYLGHARGRRYLWECMADAEVREAARAGMLAAAAALAMRHPGVFGPGELEEHVADLLRRFGNRALGDTVFRVGRDLRRKLAPGDRLLGTLTLIHEAGGDTAPVWRIIRAALAFDAQDGDGRPYEPDREFLRAMSSAAADGNVHGRR